MIPKTEKELELFFLHVKFMNVKRKMKKQLTIYMMPNIK